MQQQITLIDAVIDEDGLSLEQLAALCAVERAWLVQRIQEGLLEPQSQQQNVWRFSSASLLRVRRIWAMERDFDAAPELAALVADLQEEIDALHRRLRRSGLE